MKDKILYRQATARTYLSLSKAMRSNYYLLLAKEELKQARILMDRANAIVVRSIVLYERCNEIYDEIDEMTSSFIFTSEAA